MNIYFSQVEKRSQLFSYLLAAFAICTVMMLILSFNAFSEQRGNLPSSASQVVHTESVNVPVPIPAPIAPQDQNQTSITSLSSGAANPVPQVVAIPVPSVP